MPELQEADSRKTFLGWKEEGIDLLFYTLILAFLINASGPEPSGSLAPPVVKSNKCSRTTLHRLLIIN